MEKELAPKEIIFIELTEALKHTDKQVKNIAKNVTPGNALAFFE